METSEKDVSQLATSAKFSHKNQRGTLFPEQRRETDSDDLCNALEVISEWQCHSQTSLLFADVTEQFAGNRS